MNERFRSLPDDLRPRGRCHCCQVEAFRADPTPRYWQRRALKPVLSKNTTELKDWRAGPFRSRRVQQYKRTLRPARRAVAEFIYHYHEERNHQGLGNAFVFLDRTRLTRSR